MKKYFLLFVVFYGCHSAEVVRFDNSKQYPPTKTVEIFTDIPQEDYIEIGYVEAKGGITVKKDQLLEDMKEEAKASGADGLIKVEFYDRQYYNNTIGQYEKPGAKAVMIKFKKK